MKKIYLLLIFNFIFLKTSSSQEVNLHLNNIDFNTKKIILIENSAIITSCKNFINIYKFKNGELQKTYNTNFNINYVNAIFNNQYIAIANNDYVDLNDDYVEIIDIKTGKQIKRFENVHYMGNTPNGKFILLRTRENFQLINTVMNFSVENTFNVDGANYCTFSPDGKNIAFTTGLYKNEIVIFNIESRSIENRFDSKFTGASEITNIEYSPDGKFFAFADDGGIYGNNFQIIDIENRTSKIFKLAYATYLDAIGDIKFSPDGKYIAETYWANDGKRVDEIIIWDCISQKVVNEIEIKKGITINCIAFSPNGEYLYCVFRESDKGNLIVWKINNLLPGLSNFTKAYESIKKEKELNLEKEYTLLTPKGEYETTEDFYIRIDKTFEQIDSVRNYYQEQLKVTLSSIETNIQEIQNNKLEDIKSKINASIKDTTINIDLISTYDADKQVFTLTVKDKTFDINIPIEDAPSFKENWKKSIVKCKKKLKFDLINWEYFDFIVVNPVNNNEYPAVSK